METILNGLAQLILNTESLAKLGAIAAWVFFTLVLIFYVAWLQVNQKQASEQAWAARSEEAKADAMVASAVEKLAEQIKEIRYKIKCGGPDV